MKKKMKFISNVFELGFPGVCVKKRVSLFYHTTTHDVVPIIQPNFTSPTLPSFGLATCMGARGCDCGVASENYKQIFFFFFFFFKGQNGSVGWLVSAGGRGIRREEVVVVS
jgi:hypothetical protein